MAVLRIEVGDVSCLSDLARFLELADLLGMREDHPIQISVTGAISAQIGAHAALLPSDYADDDTDKDS